MFILGNDIMLLIRFPDGTKEKLKVKDSSKLLVHSPPLVSVIKTPYIQYTLSLGFVLIC